MNTHRPIVLGVLVVSTIVVGCREAEVIGPPVAVQTAGMGGPGMGGAPAAGSGAAPSGMMGAAGGAAPSAPDYSRPDTWLCRPGNNAACEVDIGATVVAADGSLTPEPFQPNPAPPIDCFYVYPTVSLDATPNSDLVPGPEERAVVQTQLARLTSVCRPFAPMYRQVTLASLRASLSGMPSMADRALGYNDVLAAWNYYLANDNQGRGVVLVGHSQGSSVLTQLITEQLDKAPLDPKLIAALLIGWNVAVPPNAVVGGTFQNLPLCRTPDELGCVITYVSFRANVPPPAMTLFGRSMDPNLVVGCTNPAALGGGPAELDAYLSTRGGSASAAPTPPWVMPEQQPIMTPYVRVPGLLTGECVTNASGSYLAVTVNGNPADPRVDDIVGDVIANGQVSQQWGLHLIDMNLVMGNLVDVVKAKAAAFAAR